MLTPQTQRDAVGSELVRFGVELASAGAAQVGDAFTDDPAGDAFIKASGEAFLIGILFTQGIPAERAWAGPHLVRTRLGHFDLARLAAEPVRVAAAVAAPPALHRFVKTIPAWISSAARRLIDEYDGEASRIWSGRAHVTDVTERLLAFDGIGPKKAAMAVELLVRSRGVELAGMECGSVAYDVHVRRVFLRSGLIDIDSPAEVRRAAASACPSEPGLIDLPAWLIGRETCRPRVPDCDACRLGDCCPRLTGRSVVGVGARVGERQSIERKISPESSFG
ncbi:MAG: endonuclease III [Actinobacteria bacterium]|nr:MAG: endonuclease III [Actinomycetota bacterium]